MEILKIQYTVKTLEKLEDLLCARHFKLGFLSNKLSHNGAFSMHSPCTDIGKYRYQDRCKYRALYSQVSIRTKYLILRLLFWVKFISKIYIVKGRMC